MYWVLGYNSADYSIEKYAPSHEKFKAMFPGTSDLLAYKKLDYRNNPAFAIAYLVTNNKLDLEKILQIEFNECFEELVDNN